MNLQEFRTRLTLAWAIVKGRDSNLIRHATAELTALNYFNGDPMNAAMARDIVNLLRTFSTQGHSGFSAPWCLHFFQKCASWEPLGPVLGAPSEWGESFDHDGTKQNKRCSHVFQRPDGTAYDIQAVVFEYPNGGRYTGRYSHQTVTFPYTPIQVTAKVEEDATEAEKEAAAITAWATVYPPT